MKIQNVAPENALGSFVKSVRRVGVADAYNMEVEGVHNYAIQGGYIVHNCESLRYGLMSRPSPIKEKPKEEKKTLKLVDPFSEPKARKSGFLAI